MLKKENGDRLLPISVLRFHLFIAVALKKHQYFYNLTFRNLLAPKNFKIRLIYHSVVIP